MKQHRAFWLTVISILLLALLSTKPSMAQEGGGNGDVFLEASSIELPPGLIKAITNAITKKPADFFPGSSYQIISARVEGEWALISIASMDGPYSDLKSVGAGEAGKLVIANEISPDTWIAALQDTNGFVKLLDRCPDEFISTQAKDTFHNAATHKITGANAVVYKFPWANNISWQWWTRGGTYIWHGSTDCENNTNNPARCAIDLGTSTTNRAILAAAGGTVTIICNKTTSLTVNLSILDDDGVTLSYVHINKTGFDGSKIYTGARIARGQLLGNAWNGDLNDGCGIADQYNWNSHLHFVIPTTPFVIDGWTFDYPSTCATKGGETKCAGSYFLSTNTGDVTPPTITFSIPSTAQWYNTDQTISWTISDSDTGVAYSKWAWDDSTPDNQVYSSAGSTTLSAAGQGQHTIYVQAWDNAGNASAVESRGWFGYDTLAPSNPTTISSGCGAQHNTWQNTCNNPNFTWSGASDGAGSGVKDYHYNWGTDPNGALDTYTTSSGFDPPAIPSAWIEYYLRMATRDNLNQESTPQTVFIFRYDSTLPTGSLQINQGAATTNQVDVLLNLTQSDTGSGVYEVRLSNNAVTWSTWQAYTAVIPWSIPAVNRQPLPVYVQVRDRAGNISATFNDDIFLDLYPIMPSSTSFRICQNVYDAGGSNWLESATFFVYSVIGQTWNSGGAPYESANFSQQDGLLSGLGSCLPDTPPLPGDHFNIYQSVIASAGELVSSSSYQLGDTTGQPGASSYGQFHSANFQLTSGFWANHLVNLTRFIYIPLIRR